MEQLLLTLSVVILFFVRIGIPVLVLLAVGGIIEHWQNRREQHLQKHR